MKEFSGIDELECLEDCLSGWHKAKSREILKLLEGKSLLDIGCGIGTFTRVFVESGFSVTGIDMSERCLKAAKNIKADFLMEDICRPERLGKMHEHFDSIVATDVIEHIKDDSLAINNMNKLLKPGGVLVLTVLAFSFLYSSHDRKIGHERRHSAKHVRDLLEGNGFRVERLFYWNLPGIFGWLACKMLNKNPVGAANRRTDMFYSLWLRIESAVKPPAGITIFAKVRKV
jgi:SAM-dependent methyltransferase